MSQQFDIVGNLLLKVDGAEAGLNKLRNSLSKLKMPEGLENSFKKSFSNLDGILARYKSQVEKGFNTKADVTAFSKTSKALDAELSRLSKHFTELTGKEINFKVKSDDIIRAEKELQELIEQKNQLAKDSLKFKIDGGKNGLKDIETLLQKLESAAGKTKTGEYAKNALEFLKVGNIQAAIGQLDKASASFKRLKQEKQDAFKDTGFDMGSAITAMISLLNGAEGEFGDVNTKITEIKNNLATFQAEQVQKAGQYAEDLANKFDKDNTAIRQADGAMQDFARSSQSMSQQLQDLQQSTQYFFSLRNMINLFKRGVREAVDVVKELDAAMTQTAVVTDFSVGDMWQKLPEYTANANALGATVKDMYEATTLYYQQGLRTDAAMGIANETMKMARIGGLEAADATDKMTAALRGFNMEINEASAQRVNDVYSNLAAKTASNTEELGTAMQRTASIAASAGMSFEGTAAFLAQAIETTREPAENLGTAMKTIVARFTELKKNPLEIAEVDGEEVDYNKVDTALKSIGVSLKDTNGQFRDLDKVFLDISKRWDSLTQTQQRYVATTAAGSRQQSRFIAMMSNYERTVQLMDFANNSAGASNEQFGKTMESLEAKINKLKNAWNKFLMGIMNDSWTKKIVDGTTTVIEKFNDLINLLSGGGKLKGVKSFLSLFTAFMGLKFAGGLANFGIGKLGRFVDPTTKKGALNLGGEKGIASKITTPIVAKLNELIAVTKGQKTSDKTISSTLAGYKNATNLLRMPQTMGVANSNFRQLSNEHAYAAYVNSPGTASAMKRTAMQWLSAKQLDPEMQKTGEQLMDSIFKGMARKQIPIKKGTKLIGKPELWGEYLGTETAKNFSDNFIKNQKQLQAKQIADARKQAWAQAGGDPYASDAVKELQYKTNANGIKDRYLQAYKQIRQQQKEIFGGSLNTKAVDPKPYEQLANRVGTLGSNFTAAGYSMQMFGAQLGQLSPGLADIGNLISRLGIFTSTAGMTIAGFGSTYIKIAERIVTANKAMARAKAANALVDQMRQAGMVVQEGFAGSGQSAGGAWVKGFLKGIPAPIIAAAVATAFIGVVAGINHLIEKQAQEAGKKVRESFEENFTKSDEKINSLEEYKDRFNELSKGVDQFGHNINLSAEEYDEYLNISKELQQLSPSLIAGYNAEGKAIIKKGEAVQEVIDKLKKAKQDELKLFTEDSSINKLIGEYQTSNAYKNNKEKGHREQGEYIVDQKAFDSAASAIARIGDEKILQSINQLTGWNLSSLENISTSQLSWLSKHYSDVIGLVEEQNGKLSDEVKDGYTDAFASAGSAIDEVMTEGQPIIDAMQQWMGLEGIDAIGLGLGEEFGDSFNQGLQGIMLTGLSEGWSADTFKSNIRDYANEWDELAGSTSKYADIMEDAKDVQDEYLNSMGSDSAIQNYNTNIAESCSKLIELANNTDTATAAGQAFQQQCIAQANALRNYATEGGMALSQALNTAVDDIQQAESALDNFNEATKTDLYTAAEGMKSIYDKAFETYKDSFGGEYEKHFEGKGDHTAWEAGRSILSEDVLKSIPSGQDLKNKLKEWEPALREGEEGWYNFWTKITGDSQLMENLNKIDGVKWDENDFYIPDDKWSEVAKTIGISEEMLTSMLNKGRQFANIDFTNWAETRHTLETSNVGIEGTVGTANGNGQRKLFIKEETFEAALADANYKPEEFEGKKAEAREQQNLEFLKAASEYNSQELSKVFRDEMGVSNLTDLISTLSETGDYTKDEIEAYAEKAGFKGDFDSIYDKVAEAIENPELYKQTSVLEKISSQIALLGADDNISADDALKDRNQFAKELYGTLGKIDSDADRFAHGIDKDGQKLAIEQYEATRKSLEAQKAWAEQQASMAEAHAASAAATGNSEEEAKWLEVANKYSQDAANLGTYISMGIAAFEASEQEKSTLTQQATEQAQELAKSNASNDEIKASIQEAAQQMAEAKMSPEDIAAALNSSYGTHLESKDVNIGKDGQVDLTLDEKKLQEQLSSLHADVEANITSVTMGGGHAAAASGRNNPNSIFHQHGTMARGSRRGYIINGEPTLTGELGPELVWEPKQNAAYMVGEHGPQFANLSRNAVVWNAQQTKKIKKNSKGVNSLGTGARGIHSFGTMSLGAGAGGGAGGGLSIPGTFEINATANILEVIPPTPEPTIPVKADLQVDGGGGFLSKLFGGKKGGPSIDVAANITSVNTTTPQTISVIGNITQLNNQATADNINATATVTKVTKSGQVAGEPIKVQATATTTKVENKTQDKKVSAGTQTINVTANTAAAQAKINQLINVFKKTYTLRYTASGPRSISVPISANFIGSWKKTVTISKNGGGGSTAKGANNYIAHHGMPTFNSAAGGYGQLGPKGKGGLTLTGEKGFEIAWLPSENRSMILGVAGPQMLDLPSDAVIYTHEQSKKILKQKSILAGSLAKASGSYDPSSSRYYSGGGYSGGNSSSKSNSSGSTSKKVEKAAKTVEDSAKEAADTIQKAYVWWENIARKTEASQRQQDKNQKEFEKYLKQVGANFINAGKPVSEGGGGGDDLLANMNKTLSYYEAQVKKGTEEKSQLVTGTKEQTAANNIWWRGDHERGYTESQKANKAAYENNILSGAKISYKNGKDTVDEFVNLSGYIRQGADGSLEVVQEWIDGISNLEKRKAVADAANKAADDITNKLNKGADGIEKTKEAIEKMGETLYDTFFKWENELTKIWQITQKIEQAEGRISRLKSYENLLNLQIETGIKQVVDEQGNLTDVSGEMINIFNAGVKELEDEIHLDNQNIDEQRAHLEDLVNMSSKMEALEDIQDRLVNSALRPEDQKGNTKGSGGLIDSLVSGLSQEKLNKTSEFALLKAAEGLEKDIELQTRAWDFMSATQNADGTLNIDFDSEAFEATKYATGMTTEDAEAIQKYVKDIVETNNNLSSAYDSLTSKMVDMNDKLKTLQDQWVGYAEELWKISEEEQKQEIDNLKKLSDSLTNSLKKLLDEVKRKIDQRRKQEDNAKTELDISKKQQRLASLRADTSGGNQVEIAKLQQEIADAQQNYQRSLEDSKENNKLLYKKPLLLQLIMQH